MTISPHWEREPEASAEPANRARRPREQPYGAALAVPLFVLDPGDALFEPMLPLVGLADELGLETEVSEPLTGPEGEAAALLLSVAEPSLGLVAALDPMLLSEVPAVEPLAAPWANAAGAKAATDKARPAPNK